jgi:hypothetical protein
MLQARSFVTRRRAILLCVFAGAVALVCAGLVIAAALVPAPPAVLPFVVVVGIGVPMIVTLELPPAIATLRNARVVSAFRRGLDRLPEASHPLED